jgi:alpha-glucosidase
MLSLYKAAIAQRPSGAMTWLDSADTVLLFRRGDGFLCLANCGTAPVALPDGELRLSSVPLTDTGELPADATVWLSVP